MLKESGHHLFTSRATVRQNGLVRQDLGCGLFVPSQDIDLAGLDQHLFPAENARLGVQNESEPW